MLWSSFEEMMKYGCPFQKTCRMPWYSRPNFMLKNSEAARVPTHAKVPVTSGSFSHLLVGYSRNFLDNSSCYHYIPIIISPHIPYRAIYRVSTSGGTAPDHPPFPASERWDGPSGRPAVLSSSKCSGSKSYSQRCSTRWHASKIVSLHLGNKTTKMWNKNVIGKSRGCSIYRCRF